MIWSDRLIRIRRMLRDPDGNIWTDDYLKNLWNDVQRDVQKKTLLLQDVYAIRIPPLYHCAYLHDWEWSYLPSSLSTFYQALRFHEQTGMVMCYRFEQQFHWNGTDTDDEGAHFTQPFEAWFMTPGEPVRVRFPANFHEAKGIWYDRYPIDYITKKQVTRSNSSWVTEVGQPIGYFRDDTVDNSFIIYPRPSIASWLDGGNQVVYGEDFTVDSESGEVVTATGYMASSNEGIAVDVIDSTDNILMAYIIMPTEIRTGSDDSDFQEFTEKYIEYGVLERAYTADTDGKIKSLQTYWAMRYQNGLTAIKRYMSMKVSDRDYRMLTKDLKPGRNVKHPRLPDHYPYVGV